jgi:hypothetical protein
VHRHLPTPSRPGVHLHHTPNALNAWLCGSPLLTWSYASGSVLHAGALHGGAPGRKRQPSPYLQEGFHRLLTIQRVSNTGPYNSTGISIGANGKQLSCWPGTAVKPLWPEKKWRLALYRPYSYPKPALEEPRPVPQKASQSALISIRSLKFNRDFKRVLKTHRRGPHPYWSHSRSSGCAWQCATSQGSHSSDNTSSAHAGTSHGDQPAVVGVSEGGGSIG